MQQHVIKHDVQDAQYLDDKQTSHGVATLLHRHEPKELCDAARATVELDPQEISLGNGASRAGRWKSAGGLHEARSLTVKLGRCKGPHAQGRAHPPHDFEQRLAVDVAAAAAGGAGEGPHDVAERRALVGDQALGVDHPEVLAGAALLRALLLDGCAEEAKTFLQYL